jgi:hypothetical protein
VLKLDVFFLENWSQIPRQISDACVLIFFEQMQTVLREENVWRGKKNVYSLCVKTSLLAP